MLGQGSLRAAISRFAARARLTLLSCLLTPGCKPAPLSIPEGPDMTELVQAYEQPTADFDPGKAEEVRVAVGLLDSVLERTALAGFLFSALESVVDGTESTAGGGEDGGEGEEVDLTLEADGYLRVQRICNGWVTPAVPDPEENGELDLTTTFTERGLDPVIWGNAASCRYLAGQIRLELRQVANSPYGISVHWGEGVDIQALDERRLLFAMNLTGVVGGEEIDLEFDFRTLTGRAIEYRIEESGGSIIASITRENSITLRAANGTFECADGSSCARLVAEGTDE